MNLYDMVRRADRNLHILGDVRMAKSTYLDETWRGIHLFPDATIQIKDITRFHPFRGWSERIGWYVTCPVGTFLRVSITDSLTGEVLNSLDHEGHFQTVRLPWPRLASAAFDLRITALGRGKQPIFLANHRALSRQWLIDAACGKGVEIGPGAQPQILPGDGVDVSYVEQMPPDVWNRLYNGGGKYAVRPELWDNYIVGDAATIPVEDGTLDFIFSSHVFEHLANPIGHLERWATKLKSSGRILCVVPDLSGTKDAIQYPGTMAEWLVEYRDGIWEPSVHHYERHLRRAADDKALIAAMDRKESIHVHYYDNMNCQQILNYAVQKLGYATFEIEHTPNHKDFHFVLTKG